MDQQYMRQALQVAQYAVGRTSPNPLVGAVIVKDGRIVGQGWHRQAGTEHAEIHALNQAGALAQGADAYVTLEPCAHHGRTGPCTEALIQADVARVIIAMNDPNPLVAGRGVQALRTAGIETVEGVLAAEAAKINAPFIKWVSCRLPFVVLKTAMTLDGKIATREGSSQWITNSTSRRQVHCYRDRCDAIMVGVGTVLADNPSLTTRLEDGSGRNAVRIVVDSRGRTPLTANVVSDRQAPTIIAVTGAAPSARVDALRQAGAEVLIVDAQADGKVDLRKLMLRLAERSISSILLEGGAILNGAMLEARLVDQVLWFIAPKIIGGAAAPGPIGGKGVALIDDAYLLEDMSSQLLDGDLLISAYLQNREGRDVYRTCGRIGQS